MYQAPATEIMYQAPATEIMYLAPNVWYTLFTLRRMRDSNYLPCDEYVILFIYLAPNV